jgi:hypothetical protein
VGCEGVTDCDVLDNSRRRLREHLPGVAERLRYLEDEAIGALKRLVDAEQGYETELEAIEDAGGDAAGWLRAVMLVRTVQMLPPARSG